MLISEIADKVNQLGHAWEQYKSINDQKLKTIEKKGYHDPLQDDQLNRINASLDEYKSRLSRLEIASERPALAGEEMNYHGQDSEYKNAFTNYLRKGMENNLHNLARKSLSAGQMEDGGYLVTPQMSKHIVTTLQSSCSMRSLASNETISSDSLEFIDDYHEAAAGWTSETGPVHETETPQINKRRIQVHEIYAQPKATQKLIDDSSINIEKWLAEKLSDTFSKLEEESFINGNGEAKPRGILTYKDGKNWGEIEQVTSKLDGGINADSIFNLYFALKEPYASRATFLLHRSLLHSIRMLKDTASGQYLWNPGLTAATPATLLGVPVKESATMPSASKASISIALADFKTAYKIVDRTGIRIMRDPFTEKPFIKFYATKRVGGDVMNFEAIKLMRLSA